MADENEELGEIVVTAPKVSSDGGGGGGGYDWFTWDTFVLDGGGWGGGYEYLPYDVPLEPLPYSVEVTADAIVVRAYDYATDQVHVGVIYNDNSTWQATRDMTEADRQQVPFLNYPGDTYLL